MPALPSPPSLTSLSRMFSERDAEEEPQGQGPDLSAGHKGPTTLGALSQQTITSPGRNYFAWAGRKDPLQVDPHTKETFSSWLNFPSG